MLTETEAVLETMEWIVALDVVHGIAVVDSQSMLERVRKKTGPKRMGSFVNPVNCDGPSVALLSRTCGSTWH